MPLPWSGSMRTLIELFTEHVDEFPTVPFSLGRGVHVADPARFYLMLKLDIKAGPTGPRGRNGTLEEDLVALLERWAMQHEVDAPTEPRQ